MLKGLTLWQNFRSRQRNANSKNYGILDSSEGSSVDEPQSTGDGSIRRVRRSADSTSWFSDNSHGHNKYTFLDGITAGDDAVDHLGTAIRDGNGAPTIAGTGLYREPAYDINGNVLYDHQGRRCYVKQPKEAWLNKQPREIDPNILREAHRTLQIELVNSRGILIGTHDGPGGKYIPVGTGEHRSVLYLTTDRRDCYFISELTNPEDVLGLPHEDQRLLSKLDEFRPQMEMLGLTVNDRQDGIKMTLKEYLESTSTDPRYGMRPYYNGLNEQEIQQEKDNPDSLFMNDHHTAPYRQQLSMVLQKLTNSFFVNERVINDEITKVRERFQRARAFSLGAAGGNDEQVITQTNTDAIPIYVRSSDHNQSNAEMFLFFVRRERDIMELKKAYEEISSSDTGIYSVVKTHNMLAYYIKEAETSMSIKEANSFNMVLQLYVAMQQIVIKAQASFTGDKITEQERCITGAHDTSTSQLGSAEDRQSPANELYIVSMFDSGIYARFPIDPSILILHGIPTPRHNWFQMSDTTPQGLKLHRKIVYDTYAKDITKVVDILNFKLQEITRIAQTGSKEASTIQDSVGRLQQRVGDIKRSIARNIA